MAVKLGDAVLYLSADDSKLKRTMGEAEKSTSRLGDVVTGAFMGVGMAAVNGFTSALQGAIGVIGDSIGAASDLSETIAKTGVLFGEDAGWIEEWADTASTAFGQSKQQALDAAATFGIFGKAAGLTGETLGDFSISFTELASDLASFNNTSTDQAINALGAALRGESEPLRAYGVLLDDAKVKAKAMEDGLWDGEGAISQNAKTLATYRLIMEGTRDAQGDFQRTSEGLANTQRSLTATWEDLKTKIGTAFLPVAEKAAGWALDFGQRALPVVSDFITNTLTPAIESLIGWVGDLGEKFQFWKQNYGAPWLADMKGIFEELNMPERMQGLIDAFQEFADWFKSGDARQPVSWMANIGAVIAGLTDAFMAQAERLIYGIKLLAGAFDLLMQGKFVDALAAASAAGTLLGALGPEDFTNDFLSKYRETLGQLEQSAAARAQLPNYPITPPSWGGPQLQSSGTTINQTINAATADPAAVGAAARDGLLSAMYANGMS